MFTILQEEGHAKSGHRSCFAIIVGCRPAPMGDYLQLTCLQWAAAGLQPGSPRRLRRRMTTMSMTATAASASSTTTKPIGALIKYDQIAKVVQMTKPNTASHSRNVR